MTRDGSPTSRFAPMLATAVVESFDSEEHVFEVKWDGIRCLAHVHPDGTRLHTRTGRDISRLFPELADLAAGIAVRRAVLDGELCIIDGGRPSFHHIQRRNVLSTGAAIRAAARERPALYVVFDLLHVDGRDTMDLPWKERRHRLDTLWRGHDCAVQTDAVPARGRDLYAAAVAQGLEGIVAKRVDSPYIPGRRTSYWLKIRQRRELDAVIAGYVPRGRSDFASLAMGLHRPSQPRAPGLRPGSPGISPEPATVPHLGLHYIGNVGTGFPTALRPGLMALLMELETADSPFGLPSDPSSSRPGVHSDPPYDRVPDDIRWVRPFLVARIQYLEFTPGGRLRHPSFVDLRDDKRPEECIYEGERPETGEASGPEGGEL